MKKKFLAVLLAVTMVAVGLSGCGKNSGGDEAESGSAIVDSSTVEAGDNFNETGYPIVNEPITLKVMLGIRDLDTLMDINEMECIKELEEKTNIHVEWEVVKGNDWDTKVNLMFASGEYPDVILSSPTTIDYEEYGVSQQLLLPVDDLVDKYMPIYKERTEMEESNPLAGLIASDGKTYSIGYLMAQNINTNAHYFINQTWLDTLNLQTPSTLEELNDVLRAFKTQDPNGNGQADEIPIQLGIDTGFYGVRYFLPMFGIPCNGDNWLYIDDDGNVQFAPAQEGFRSCMEWLNMLYQEELLDPEVISQDEVTIQTKYGEGNIGFCTAWRLTGMGLDEGIAKDCKLFMPVAEDGYKVSMYKTMELANDGAYILRTNKHIPETMRWLDSILETDTMFNVFAGPGYWEYNEEGLIETHDADPSQVLEALNVNSLFYAPGTYYSSVYQMAPHRVEKMEYCQKYTEAGAMQKNSNDYLKLAPRTADEISRCTLLQTDIDNAVKENIANFITGGVTDDNWKNFTDMFDKLNVEDYVSIYQTALDKSDFNK
ncbi:extracellular solute-binding protein [Eisenbergiella sp.]